MQCSVDCLRLKSGCNNVKVGVWSLVDCWPAAIVVDVADDVVAVVVSCSCCICDHGLLNCCSKVCYNYFHQATQTNYTHTFKYTRTFIEVSVHHTKMSYLILQVSNINSCIYFDYAEIPILKLK